LVENIFVTAVLLNFKSVNTRSVLTGFNINNTAVSQCLIKLIQQTFRHCNLQHIKFITKHLQYCRMYITLSYTVLSSIWQPDSLLCKNQPRFKATTEALVNAVYQFSHGKCTKRHDTHSNLLHYCKAVGCKTVCLHHTLYTYILAHNTWKTLDGRFWEQVLESALDHKPYENFMTYTILQPTNCILWSEKYGTRSRDENTWCYL
jgi:hypothetical protein